MHRTARIIATRFDGWDVYVDSPIGWEWQANFATRAEAEAWAEEHAADLWR